jgi:hypothetical protein
VKAKEEDDDEGGKDESKYQEQHAVCKLLKQLFTQYRPNAIILTMLALLGDTVAVATACTSHSDCENNSPLFCRLTEQQRLLCYNS